MNNFSSVCVLIAFSYMLLWPARHVRTNKVERERAWFEIIMRQNFLSFFFTAFLNCKFSRNLIICVRAFFTFVLRARASQHIRIIKIYFVFFFQKKKKEKKTQNLNDDYWTAVMLLLLIHSPLPWVCAHILSQLLLLRIFLCLVFSRQRWRLTTMS